MGAAAAAARQPRRRIGCPVAGQARRLAHLALTHPREHLRGRPTNGETISRSARPAPGIMGLLAELAPRRGVEGGSSPLGPALHSGAEGAFMRTVWQDEDGAWHTTLRGRQVLAEPTIHKG